MADEHRLYNNVDMDHPSIRAAIETMTRQGESKEKIMRVVGVPGEVVDKHQKSMPKEVK
jgi:hypothetical protein